MTQAREETKQPTVMGHIYLPNHWHHFQKEKKSLAHHFSHPSQNNKYTSPFLTF